MQHIAALMTCFNRREKTLACLESLFSQPLPDGYGLHVFLVDDGSTDGTDEAVQARFPTAATVIRGNGNLFWNGGMRAAMGVAMLQGFNFYLWMNDDTQLFPGALNDLLATHNILCKQLGKDSIVVGSICDPLSGKTSYGGRVRSNRWQPLYYSLVEPGDEPFPCDSMNGNCVLIPASAAQAVGNLEAAFVHSMGDWDYGYRATALGIPIYVAPGHVGECHNDARARDARANLQTVRDHWRKVTGPKGLPFHAWMVYTRRHAGPFWPLYWIKPYVMAVMTGLGSGSSKK
ncbi:MAG: glycosyltransferase family 2 protein [Sulfuricella sp.]|nr:glycosyltransferase family 2 protein [Gammaproteobacteria bacterium]